MNKFTSQKIMNGIFTVSAIITISILLLIISYILGNGLDVVDFEFIFAHPEDAGKTGGIWPMIVSTFYLVVISLLIAILIGVGSAVYISQYSSNHILNKLLTFICEILAAIPSIIFGLFGFAFFIMFLKFEWSILTGSFVLALMSIPTIFQVSYVTVQSISDDVKQASLALGASKWQCIKTVILPMSLSGIFTGVILAITRAVSEAAAVMYVVGSSIQFPTSILDAGRPLALHLYVLASEGISMENAFGTASVLILIVLGITIVSNFIIYHYQSNSGV